jgi:SH3 domain-containing protein/excalibur calcium-binding domain-containing protein
MKKFSLFLLFLLSFTLVLSVTAGLAQEQCGVERWSVKTGTDADASKVDLTTSVPTTIADMTALAKPSALPSKQRLEPTETTVWVIQATLIMYKQEDDSDYHLVISDEDDNTMIVEIPSPDCVGNNSPFLVGIALARMQFDDQFTATSSPDEVSIPVQVTGVGFFDSLHGQTGVAPNGIELHPVLNIIFNPESTSATPSSPEVGKTYFVNIASARVRSSADTSATVVATLSRSKSVVILEVVRGTSVNGSTTWYRIRFNREEGYIHSSLVSKTLPSTGSSGTGSNGGVSVSTPAPISTPVPPSGSVSCGGATTCGQMTSCAQAYACLAAGRSSLDRDKDGVPCESICPGG